MAKTPYIDNGNQENPGNYTHNYKGNANCFNAPQWSPWESNIVCIREGPRMLYTTTIYQTVAHSCGKQIY